MYEDGKKKINWTNVFKHLVIILAVLLVIFGIVALITKCSNSSATVDETKKETKVEKVDLTNELNQMEEATIKYLTKETMPKELNAVKTIKLKYLINKELISDLKASNGDVCDVNSSISEITRLENNYAVKITLNCGKNSDYRVVYVGCYDICENNGICKAKESTASGICVIEEEKTNSTSDKKDVKPETKPNNSNKNSNSSASQNNENKNTQPNNAEPKAPSNENANNLPDANNTDQNSSNNNDSNVNETPKTDRVMYQYSRCYTKYVCVAGNLNEFNQCIYTENGVKKIGKPIKFDNYCDYMWSYSDNVAGWTKTGKTKIVS